MNTADPTGTLPKASPGGLSALGLKLLAMALMLCDHLWASVASDQAWFTHIGRIAFPIFAFQIAEGFARTHDRKRYLLRMLVFAAVSEVPFNLFYAGTAVYPFHQNVMFTFVLAILLLLGWKWGWLPELLGLLYLNGVVLAGEELTAFGVTFPEQGLAVLALVPILCYRGRQGPHSRAIQYACYAFYPVHMLILFLAQRALG